MIQRASDESTAGPLHILCGANDVGGLNLVAAMLRRWSGDRRIVATFVSTTPKFEMLSPLLHMARPPWADAVRESSGMDALAGATADLNEAHRVEAYHAVFVATSLSCPLERQLLRWARRNHVCSFAICDMWYAYRQRFGDADGPAVPDFIFAVDKRMADEILAEPALAAATVLTTGNPMYDELLDGQAISKKSGEEIIFVSEPVAAVFPESRIDESAIAAMVVRAATDCGAVERLKIRPHPLESAGKWLGWVSAQSQPLAVERCTLTELYRRTSRAIGVSSILLTQLALRGVPVASVQLPGSDPNYYCLPFEDFGIVRLTSDAEIRHFLSGDSSPPKLSATLLAHRGARGRITAEILGRTRVP